MDPLSEGETMSPVTHAAAGLLGWQTAADKKNLKTLAFFILLANLPDLDFVFYLLLGEKVVGLHQYYTHNVFFAGFTALVFWAFFKTKKERLALLLVAFSHLALDFLTIDGVPPIGFRLFFPLSGQLFNFGIFPNLMKGTWAEVYSWHNLQVVCFEAAISLVPLFLVFRGEWVGYLKKLHKKITEG
jgi:hypothetical protein